MGLLVAIEGIDGSGKGTQAALLHQRLQQAGRRSALFSFPRYQQTHFGRMVGQFLNGRFGNLDEADPFLVSLLYAGDRLESKAILQQALDEYDVVICDRFVPSNIAHQGAKLTGPARQELIDWILTVEHEVYGLPRPDAVLFLELPVPQAQELIACKARRAYTDQVADLQEADGQYLEAVRQVYLELAAREPGWQRIPSTDNGTLRSVEDIGRNVFDAVERLLAQTPVSSPSVAALGASRRRWIDNELEPWCRIASLQELKKAELDWANLAGQVGADQTLWRWAWSRFADLVHPELGLDETHAVRVQLKRGDAAEGYPDARQTRQGMLVVTRRGTDGQWTSLGPWSIDEIVSVTRLAGEP